MSKRLDLWFLCLIFVAYQLGNTATPTKPKQFRFKIYEQRVKFSPSIKIKNGATSKGCTLYLFYKT